MLVGYDTEWDPVSRKMHIVYPFKGWTYLCELSAEVMDEVFGAGADYTATFVQRWPEIRLAVRDKINRRDADPDGIFRLATHDLLLNVPAADSRRSVVNT